MLQKIFWISLFLWFLVFYGVKGQTIVGMGTDNPNPHAVLELVSENQNQGFLVPRLSTQQRNAVSFISGLTNQDNGLLVFDTDEGNFYYWYEGMWRLGSGITNSTPQGNVNEKITSASLVTGDILRIQEAGSKHDVDLSVFQKKTLPESQVLVGNALSIATPVNISGDIILNSNGTMTITLDAVTTAKIINNAITTVKIADGAVTKEKINADVSGNGLANNVDGSLEVNVAGGGLQITTDQLQLTNKGDGEVLIGDGTRVRSRSISGDISLVNTGVVTVSGLQGKPVGTTAPTANDVLTWNGSAWVPHAVPSASNGWYSGSLIPDATTPSGSIDGNYYYHTGTQTVYRKESSAWVELGNWTKQSNSTVQNATITSTRTPKIYIGSGQPTNGTTNNAQPGDMYFDTSDGSLGRVYIKKNESEWQGL